MQIIATSSVTMFIHAVKMKILCCFTQTKLVGFLNSPQLVLHVSGLRCASGGIRLNKIIKSQECPILSASPGRLLCV